ncbi:MAG: condensin complex protein MksE, partial [Bacteroidales bacterium]
TYNSAFGSGFTFRTADIQVEIGCNIDLKEKVSKLFSEKKKHSEVIDQLIKELKNMGFIEEENELDGTWKVLTAFHYIEELIDCITISEEFENEISE